MVRIEHVNVEEERDNELAAEKAAKARAVQDYNIMMGNIEDPADESEVEKDG